MVGMLWFQYESRSGIGASHLTLVLGTPSTVDVPASDPTDAATQEHHMGMMKKLVKGAVAAKVIQIAARELQKPENQAKIREGLNKLGKTTRSR